MQRRTRRSWHKIGKAGLPIEEAKKGDPVRRGRPQFGFPWSGPRHHQANPSGRQGIGRQPKCLKDVLRALFRCQSPHVQEHESIAGPQLRS